MTTSQTSSAAATPLLPKSGWIPKVTDLLNYRYLWRHDHERGDEDGIKIRPSLVVSVTERPTVTRIIVVPLSTQNLDPDHSFRVPTDIAQRLGLDPNSHIVASETNLFDWIGPDVFHRGIPPKLKHTHFGALPNRLVLNIIDHLIGLGVSPIRRT